MEVTKSREHCEKRKEERALNRKLQFRQQSFFLNLSEECARCKSGCHHCFTPAPMGVRTTLPAAVQVKFTVKLFLFRFIQELDAPAPTSSFPSTTTKRRSPMASNYKGDEISLSFVKCRRRSEHMALQGLQNLV